MDTFQSSVKPRAFIRTLRQQTIEMKCDLTLLHTYIHIVHIPGLPGGRHGVAGRAVYWSVIVLLLLCCYCYKGARFLCCYWVLSIVLVSSASAICCACAVLLLLIFMLLLLLLLLVEVSCAVVLLLMLLVGVGRFLFLFFPILVVVLALLLTSLRIISSIFHDVVFSVVMSSMNMSSCLVFRWLLVWIPGHSFRIWSWVSIDLLHALHELSGYFPLKLFFISSIRTRALKIMLHWFLVSDFM